MFFVVAFIFDVSSSRIDHHCSRTTGSGVLWYIARSAASSPQTMATMRLTLQFLASMALADLSAAFTPVGVAGPTRHGVVTFEEKSTKVQLPDDS